MPRKKVFKLVEFLLLGAFLFLAGCCTKTTSQKTSKSNSKEVAVCQSTCPVE